MDSRTVSKVDATLEINGNVKISCQLKRHLSPITVGLITRMLPLKGNAHQMGQSVVYFETKINSGVERKRIDFKKGDIEIVDNLPSSIFTNKNLLSLKINVTPPSLSGSSTSKSGCPNKPSYFAIVIFSNPYLYPN